MFSNNRAHKGHTVKQETVDRHTLQQKEFIRKYPLPMTYNLIGRTGRKGKNVILNEIKKEIQEWKSKIIPVKTLLDEEYGDVNVQL